MQNGVPKLDLSFTMSPRMLTLLSCQHPRGGGDSPFASAPASTDTNTLTHTDSQASEPASIDSSFSTSPLCQPCPSPPCPLAQEKEEIPYAEEKLCYAPPLPWRPSPTMVVYACQNSFSDWMKLPCLLPCALNPASTPFQACSRQIPFQQKPSSFVDPSFADWQGEKGGRGEFLPPWHQGQREFTY